MKICLTEGCENIAEGRTEFCGSCNRLHRKVAKQRVAIAEKKRPKSIAKVSDKMKQKLDEYNVLRWEYLKEHPKCEMRLIGCEGDSIEIHHCSGRGMYLNVVSTWKATCRHCHTKLHDKLSAQEAREKGLKI